MLLQWQDKLRQRVREVRFAMDECAAAGVPYESVMQSTPGAPAPGQTPDTSDPDLQPDPV